MNYNFRHGKGAPTKPNMALSDAIKKLYENRIAELEKSIADAMSATQQLQEKLQQSVYALTALLGLRTIHDNLCIASTVMSAVKDYNSCLVVGEVKRDDTGFDS